jgi:hypothetical protein
MGLLVTIPCIIAGNNGIRGELRPADILQHISPRRLHVGALADTRGTGGRRCFQDGRETYGRSPARTRNGAEISERCLQDNAIGSMAVTDRY